VPRITARGCSTLPSLPPSLFLSLPPSLPPSRGEIEDIATGKLAVEESPLRHAPHTIDTILQADWTKPYSRETACYPAPWVKANKFWPSVGRLDNVYGDRNLICSCPPLETYLDEEDGREGVA
jgi:glycine dehydrogenase